MTNQTKQYFHLFDRPIFKTFGVIITVFLFVSSYLVLVAVSDTGVDSTVGILLPSVFVLVWEALKRRNIWFIWFLGAVVCLLMYSLFGRSSNFCILLANAYWVFCLVICICSILVCSRAERRARDRAVEMEVQQIPIDDPVKDAFLQQLFGEE